VDRKTFISCNSNESFEDFSYEMNDHEAFRNDWNRLVEDLDELCPDRKQSQRT
jgi:hypothetical protein